MRKHSECYSTKFGVVSGFSLTGRHGRHSMLASPAPPMMDDNNGIQCVKREGSDPAKT